MRKLKKSAIFTDIHFGRNSNSDVHNQDCINFIQWFCNQVKADSSIDSILFLGDWYENRSSINIQTLNYSYRALKMLDSLGLPIFAIIGNHDLYFKHSREVHSVVHHNEFPNFHLYDHPTVLDYFKEKVLFCPFLQPSEYESLHQYNNIPIWFGHFEFKGFIVTGYNIVMLGGVDPSSYTSPTVIISGHFHKRQVKSGSNIVYVGNCFPMDFGDAGDFDRGMSIYDFTKNEITYKNWLECPKYIKTKITDLLVDRSKRSEILLPNARVICLSDEPLNFEEACFLKQKFINDYGLREFVFEEPKEFQQAFADTETNVDWDDVELQNVDEIILKILQDIELEHLNPQKLTDIYLTLRVDH